MVWVRLGLDKRSFLTLSLRLPFDNIPAIAKEHFAIFSSTRITILCEYFLFRDFLYNSLNYLWKFCFHKETCDTYSTHRISSLLAQCSCKSLYIYLRINSQAGKYLHAHARTRANDIQY